MAGLSQDKRSGNWFIFFRFGGKIFNRSTSTQDQGEAEAIRTRVEQRLRLLEQGLVDVPPEANLWEWLKSDGKRTAPLNLAPRHPTLSEVIKQFFDTLPPDTAKEQGDQSWRDVQRLHCDHFLSVVGNPRLPLLLNDWQRYIAERARGRGKPWAGRGKRRGKKPARGTISKEVSTVRRIYDRYAGQAGLDSAPTDSRLVYPTGREKPPFMTWEQIDHRVKDGGLPEGEEAELRDALYLDPGQVGELLAFIAEKRQKHDFFYPRVFTAAATGARASELRRAMLQITTRRRGNLPCGRGRRSRGSSPTAPFRSTPSWPSF